jgi:hypothetical protein
MNSTLVFPQKPIMPFSPALSTYTFPTMPKQFF